MSNAKGLLTVGLIGLGLWLFTRRRAAAGDWDVGAVRLDAWRDRERRARTPPVRRLVKRVNEPLTVQIHFSNLSKVMRSVQLELYSGSDIFIGVTQLFDVLPGKSVTLALQWGVSANYGLKVGKDNKMYLNTSHRVVVAGESKWGSLGRIPFVLHIAA